MKKYFILSLALLCGAFSLPAFAQASGAVSAAVIPGQNVTLVSSFSPAPTNASALSYQWNFNGTPISGATASSLSLPNISAANAGVYTLTVTFGSGTITSPPATVQTVILIITPVVK